MADRRVPTAPKGLMAAGKALWQQIQGGLPDDCELDERETAILAMACSQADDVAALERAVKRSGRVVSGSRGQPRLAQAVIELRQGRMAVAKLLGELALQGEGHQGESLRTKQARRAVNTRWARRDELAARRRALDA